MICKGLTAQMVVMAQNMDEAARRTRECRRTRRCVWCDDPVAEGRVYPACEECRDYKGIETP